MGDNHEHKINIKARIDRHSRMLKDNFTVKSRVFTVLKRNNLTYKIIISFLLLVLPIYPMFAWIVHNNTEYEFYRWYIDEESILGSYYEVDDQAYIEDVYETSDGFISDIAILNEDRNYDWTNDIRTYVVKSWDSISVIASSFKVTRDTIYEFNGLPKNHTLKPWETLKIPATSWIPYKVKSWDTLLAIANKYEINSDKIVEFNNLADSRDLKIGQELFLPWAKKIIVAPPKYVAPKTKWSSSFKKTTNYVSSQYSSSQWVYKLIWRTPYSGAWWNCTYYVSSYKNVNWRWNANQWMYNAAAKWHTVKYGRWFVPKLWAIVSFSWRWYNVRYWHVWIVMEIKGDYMIVSDMNYRRINEVTYRKVSLYDRAIVWYIYSN